MAVRGTGDGRVITTDAAREIIRDAMAEVGFFKPDLVTYGDPNGAFGSDGRVLMNLRTTPKDELRAFHKAWRLVTEMTGGEPPLCCAECFVIGLLPCPHVEANA